MASSTTVRAPSPRSSSLAYYSSLRSAARSRFKSQEHWDSHFDLIGSPVTNISGQDELNFSKTPLADEAEILSLVYCESVALDHSTTEAWSREDTLDRLGDQMKSSRKKAGSLSQGWAVCECVSVWKTLLVSRDHGLCGLGRLKWPGVEMEDGRSDPGPGERFDSFDSEYLVSVDNLLSLDALLADLQNTISPPGSGLTSPGSGYGSLNGPRLREHVVSTERYETSPASWSGSLSDLYAIWMNIDTPLATDQIVTLNLSSDLTAHTSPTLTSRSVADPKLVTWKYVSCHLQQSSGSPPPPLWYILPQMSQLDER
uniref:Uncharacterized protein n=1 Tax=Timema cristinae TaxID=61476 RepID=A0A7R9GWQ2_TIMCR|nr:unnamed protein product [Timema cristinae]